MATTPRKTGSKATPRRASKTAKTTAKPRATAAKSSATASPPPAAAAAAKRGSGSSSRSGTAVPKSPAKPRAKPAAKSVPKPAVAATIVADKPVVAGPTMKKPALIDRVVARTGMKKKDVKPVVEAAMAILGEALEDGREVNFPELGKIKVNREKELSSAKVIICKLRRNKANAGSGPGPLAKAAE